MAMTPEEAKIHSSLIEENGEFRKRSRELVGSEMALVRERENMTRQHSELIKAISKEKGEMVKMLASMMGRLLGVDLDE